MERINPWIDPYIWMQVWKVFLNYLNLNGLQIEGISITQKKRFLVFLKFVYFVPGSAMLPCEWPHYQIIGSEGRDLQVGYRSLKIWDSLLGLGNEWGRSISIVFIHFRKQAYENCCLGLCHYLWMFSRPMGNKKISGGENLRLELHKRDQLFFFLILGFFPFFEKIGLFFL